MGYVPRCRLEEAAARDLDITVYDRTTVDELDRIGRSRGVPLRCHLKLETGTNRQGIPEEELEDYLERFAAAPGLRLAGISTHFANIEDTTDHSYARLQLDRFRRMAARVRLRFPDAAPHAACSAALLVMPETGFTLGRVGIGAYGIWPSRETLASHAGRGQKGVRLRPALTWKARVAQVKWVPAGSYIGYGCTHRTSRRTRLAVLPVGYADGYDRRFSNLAHVLLRGGRARVLGRVCMNLFMVDATDLEGVETEEVAVLIGRQNGDEIRAADLAAVAQTIPYEIVSRISPALPRFAVDGTGHLLGA
jgi:alanine racemase